MKKFVGELMIGTAILHTVVGLTLGYTQLQAIAQSGLLNSIDPHFDRMAIFWFLSYGALLFIIGGMMRWMQRQTGRLPAWLAWMFWGMGVPSVILMPISGLWLLFPLGWLAYQNRPKSEQLTTQSI